MSAVWQRLRWIDWWLLMATAGLCAVGFATVLSARAPFGDGAYMLLKQIVALGIGVLLMIAVSAIPRQIWTRWATGLYVVNVLLLVYVDFVGRSAKGAQRWIPLPLGFNLQPSEIAKFALIITLATFIWQKRTSIDTPATFFKALLHVGIPWLLVFKQPDLGTSLVLLAIWTGMLLVARVPVSFFVLMALLGLIGFGVLWTSGGLKDYQKKRITVFLDPGSDPRGAGYHVNQARIAIGSGRVTGQGWNQGTQKKLRFIPEQHTDFALTVPGEEFGFAGLTVIYGLYTLFLSRLWIIMYRALRNSGSDFRTYDGCVAAGVFCFFAYHIIVNSAMVLGLLPVVGVWLPFISFGGTALMTCLAMIGLALAVHREQAHMMF